MRYLTALALIIKTSVASLALIGVGAYKLSDTQNKSNASWTNSYEPSTKWDFNWDRRDPKNLIKPKSKTYADFQKEKEQSTNTLQLSEVSSTCSSEFHSNEEPNGKKMSKARRHLILVRHGQYETHQRESSKKILTLLGEEQADFTGRRLGEINFKNCKLYHSTMIRAIQTADIIRKYVSQEIPVEMDDMLKEGAPIPPEPPIGRWMPEYYFFEDGSRIEAAFRKYFYRADPEQIEDSHDIIVCHANVIRYFLCRALQFPPEAWLRFELAHASLTHITILPDGRVKCESVGEAGHMPINKRSVS